LIRWKVRSARSAASREVSFLQHTPSKGISWHAPPFRVLPYRLA
jgi:hypothetical protein